MKNILMLAVGVILFFVGFNLLSELKLEKTKYDKTKWNKKANFFLMPATKYNRLDGINVPPDLEYLKRISIRMCAGEYEPFSVLLQSDLGLDSISIAWDDIKGESYLPQNIIDVFIVKVWYQAGITSKDIRFPDKKLLTQELLLKNDSLVRINRRYESNLLLVESVKGEKKYINISDETAEFPQNIIIKDSKDLLPFNLSRNRVKQIWFRIHMPDSIRAGIYKTKVRIFEKENEIFLFPLEIQVLPFSLDSPKLTYSLYYHGVLKERQRNLHFIDKTEEQLRMELLDMKEHGVFYPVNDQKIDKIEQNLIIRKQMGLPTDKIFTTQIIRFQDVISKKVPITAIPDNISAMKNMLQKLGYEQFYVYGIDEAKGENLTKQRPYWKLARESGAKIFVATGKEAFSKVGDLLDAAVLYSDLDTEQAKNYHSIGHQVFSYHNPQVGQENPEIYRRNYGLALWKAGYDGAMDYAYQKGYGSIWNDFDDPKKRFRDETFVYPTTTGLVSTIQWEGFREGIDDVRYISTLLNRIDTLRSQGLDVSNYESWLDNLNPDDDLDSLRTHIIDKILSTFK